MKEFRGTPGEWTVAGRTGYINQIEIAPAICTAYGSGVELEANARLLAASKDLLEALDAIIEDPDSSIGSKNHDRAIAALRKALGK